MIKLMKKIFGGEASKVFKGMATLAMGSGVARLIGIAAIPVLTRLYSPEDFGVLAVFTALVAILAPLVTFRYALALPLPRQDGTALNLLALSAILMFCSVALVTLLLAVLAGPVLGIFSMQSLQPWWWLIVLGVLGTASYELMTYWATRKRNYKVIAQTNVWQSLSGNLVKVGMGIVATGAIGLLLGAVLAQGGGLVKLLRNYVQDIEKIPRVVSWGRLKRVAWGYRGFPYFRVPSQLLMVISQQAPLLFSAAIFGPGSTGQLSLALMALAIPVNLLGGSMGRALYAEAASIGVMGSERIYRMTKDVQIKLFYISIPIGLLLYFFGQSIFVIVFGDNWEQAGLFASLLSIHLVFQFTSAPLVQLLNLVASQTKFLLLNVARILLILFLVFSVYYFDASIESFVLYYSFLMALFYLYVTIFVIKSIRK